MSFFSLDEVLSEYYGKNFSELSLLSTGSVGTHITTV